MGDAPSIQVALAAVKDAVGAVAKSQKNIAQNFSFRGIDAVVNAAAPLLNKHGVITVPRVLNYTYDTVEVGQRKTSMAHVVLSVEYKFFGPAGDFISATVLAEAMDSGDKGVPKAMSVAYRIALLQVLNLPTDEPDPDESVYERSSVPAAAPRNVTRGSAAASKGNITVVTLHNAQAYLDEARKLNDADGIRALYKSAATKGFLKEEIEGKPLSDHLTELGSHSKSTESPAGGVPGSDGAQ